MADAAGHFDRHDLKDCVAAQERAEHAKRVANSFHFWFPRASDRDKKFLHRQHSRSARPKLRLLFGRKPVQKKFLQFLHRGEHCVGATKHPAADLFGRQRSDEIHGNALSMGHRELRSRAAALSASRVPVANKVVGAVFDQVEIESNNFPDGATEPIEVNRFPLAKVCGFFVGEILLLVFRRIVDAMAKLFGEKRSELAAPKLSAILSKLDWAAQIRKHMS